MIHKTNVDYEGGINKLAEDLGDLRYDVLADFLYALSCKISKDAHKDKMAGRDKIANELNYSAACIRKAWMIAKPYMEDKVDNVKALKEDKDFLSKSDRAFQDHINKNKNFPG
jgi:hypothetical protein